LPRIPINLPGWYATWKPLRHDGAGAQKVYFSAEGVATSHGLIAPLGSAALITERGEEPVEELRLATRQLDPGCGAVKPALRSWPGNAGF
jgi:hypothetical protein